MTDQLAVCGDGGWRFVTLWEGFRAWVADEGIEAIYRSGAWDYGAVRGSGLWVAGTKVVGARQLAIADAAGGAVVDTEGRSTLGQILAILRAHGLIAT